MVSYFRSLDQLILMNIIVLEVVFTWHTYYNYQRKFLLNLFKDNEVLGIQTIHIPNHI